CARLEGNYEYYYAMDYW
nr:immunoglobulin heavy chain junction region [Mus musculus]MBK4195129.1 immunoglobulin heavy chain junction region [Mus musculus]